MAKKCAPRPAWEHDFRTLPHLCSESASFDQKIFGFSLLRSIQFFIYKYIFAVAFRGRFRKRWNERLSRASSSTPVRVEVAVAQNVVARISQVSVFLAAAALGLHFLCDSVKRITELLREVFHCFGFCC